jgi:predicted ATPase
LNWRRRASRWDWSYDLLTPSEQSLLQQLSVFAGGFPLEAAEAVCGDSSEPRAASNEARAGSALGAHPSSLAARNDVLDLLTRLVDKSLVIAEQGERAVRYRMLATVRQYAEAKLNERTGCCAGRARRAG